MSSHLSRRKFIRSIAYGVGAAALPRLALADDARQPLGDRPNVIIVCSDQHRWQSMSFTDFPELSTPTMARMAGEGFSFDRYLANYPTCSPARAMMMTGRWPNQTGVLDNATKEKSVLSPREFTIGRAFRLAGYRTGYIGKWHLGGLAKTLEPFGFDESIVWMRSNNHWDSFFFENGENRTVSKRYNATHMTDQALEFIERNQKQPFFLELMWNPPHSDFLDPPPDLMRRYSVTNKLPFRKNLRVTEDRPPETFGDRYWGYHGHVTAIDRELDRILKAAEALRSTRDTIVIYTSDHGGMLASHGVFGKRFPYAEALRIPFIVHWPGKVPGGGRSEAPVGSLDFMPTVCGLAGLGRPATCAGSDCSPLARGETAEGPESQLIMHVRNEHSLNEEQYPADLFRGVVTRRYTYARREDGPWLLFDDQNDPYQLRNLVDEKKHEGTKDSLTSQLREWLATANDSFPVG